MRFTRTRKYILNTSNLSICAIDHGKGEVDHVGGTAKVVIRREIAAEKVLLHCDDILDFLKDKFEPSKQTYVFNESKKLIQKDLRLTDTNTIQNLNRQNSM